jgi:hypothetical protein
MNGSIFTLKRHNTNSELLWQGIGVTGDFAGPLNALPNFFQSGVTSDSGTVEVQ